jgi:hypothetical protein
MFIFLQKLSTKILFFICIISYNMNEKYKMFLKLLENRDNKILYTYLIVVIIIILNNVFNIEFNIINYNVFLKYFNLLFEIIPKITFLLIMTYILISKLLDNFGKIIVNKIILNKKTNIADDIEKYLIDELKELIILECCSDDKNLTYSVRNFVGKNFILFHIISKNSECEEKYYSLVDYKQLSYKTQIKILFKIVFFINNYENNILINGDNDKIYMNYCSKIKFNNKLLKIENNGDILIIN